MGSTNCTLNNNNMSSLTDEWQLRTKENCIKYIIDIRNFDKKVKSFNSGRTIYSKKFKIASSTFQVQIYPGGNTSKEKNHVGAYLLNKSDWRVKAKAEFSILNENFSSFLPEDYFQSDNTGKNSWGFPKFISHDRCKRNDLLTDDGMFRLQVDVELLEEEITPDRNLTKSDSISKLENLEEIIQGQKLQIDDLETKVDTLQSSNRKEMTELKNMIRELSISVRHPAQPPATSSPHLECPVCLEVVRRPMRLKQCGQGHIICDSCHDKAEAEANAQWEAEVQDRVGNPDLDLCHTCRGVITGRPSQLERILGLN